MTTIIKSKKIERYYITLSVSLNYQGFNVYDVMIGEQVGESELYNTRLCKFYNDRTQATKAYNYYRRKIEKEI